MSPFMLRLQTVSSESPDIPLAISKTNHLLLKVSRLMLLLSICTENHLRVIAWKLVDKDKRIINKFPGETNVASFATYLIAKFFCFFFFNYKKILLSHCIAILCLAQTITIEN